MEAYGPCLRAGADSASWRRLFLPLPLPASSCWTKVYQDTDGLTGRVPAAAAAPACSGGPKAQPGPPTFSRAARSRSGQVRASFSNAGVWSFGWDGGREERSSLLRQQENDLHRGEGIKERQRRSAASWSAALRRVNPPFQQRWRESENRVLKRGL